VAAVEVGDYRGEIVALDAASGAIRTHKLSSAPYDPPTTVNDLVFATASALDDETGREVGSTELPSGINAGLAVSGDTVLAPAGLELGPEETPELVAYRLSNQTLWPAHRSAGSIRTPRKGRHPRMRCAGLSPRNGLGEDRNHGGADMAQVRTWVGLDVHAAKIVAAIADSGVGRVGGAANGWSDRAGRGVLRRAAGTGAGRL
jgi:hypothetical protein